MTHRFHPAALNRPLLRSLRFAATVATALAVLALDAVTPRGLAIWLMQVILMWVTSLWATPKQILITCILCVICTGLGFWWSPRAGIEDWVSTGNLLLAAVSVCAIAHTGWREKRAEQDRLRAAEDLARSQEEIKVLTGLLPICASCKKIRGDSGNWEQMEMYITRHSEAQFSHGICEVCMSILYPELFGSSPKSHDA